MMTFSESEIEAAAEKVSPQIRSLVEDGVLSETVGAIARKNNLHVDVSGKIAERATLMVIGLVSPSQFTADLKEAGLGDQVANTILQDLNEQILKPLYEEMRNTPKEPVPKEEAASIVVPPAAPPAPPTEVKGPVAPKPLEVPATPPPVRTMVSDVRAVKEPSSFVLPKPIEPQKPVMPPAVSTPQPPAPNPKTPTKEELSDSLKSYGVDPYREPVE